MNNLEPFSIALTVLGALAAWAGCRLWYGRKMRLLGARVHKLHSDRETLQEQVKQARLQVGQLQQDMAARVKADSAAVRNRAVTPAAAAAAQAQSEAKAALKARMAIPSGMVFEAPQLAAHGFADTQPFEEK